VEKLLRILFIEDSEDDVFLITSHIQSAGYTVSSTTVDNGQDFVKALEQKDYWDAILSDYALPGFSGRRALDIFRKTGLKIPFILVSGALGEDIAVLMLKSGASDFILKGNLRRLVPAIERGVEENRHRQERRTSEQAVSIAESILLRSPVVVYQGSLNLDETPKFVADNFNMFGFDLEEFRQEKTPFSAIIHADDLERITAEIFRHNKLKVDSYVLQYRIVNKAQEIYEVKDYVTVVRNEQGEVAQREGALIWITGQEMSPEKQQENFEIYKSLFQDSIELLLIVAPETLNIIDANRSACIYYGYTHEQILNKKIFDLSIKSMGDLQSEFNNALQTHNYRTFDKHKLADGQIRTVEIQTGQVILGGKVYIRMVVFDVTVQNTNEKMAVNYDSYKGLLDILPNSTMITDLQLKILYANSGCVNLFGYSSFKEMMGKQEPEWLSPVYVKVFSEQHILETLINKGQLPSLKVELLSKNGAVFWNSLDFRLINNTEGKAEGLLVVFSDTSKEHRAFKDLKRSELQLQPDLENSLTPMAMVTMDDSFIQVNKPFIGLMHWESSDYSQLTLPDLFSPEDKLSYKSAVQQLTDESQAPVVWEGFIKIENQPAQQVRISVSLIFFETTPQYYMIRIE